MNAKTKERLERLQETLADAEDHAGNLEGAITTVEEERTEIIELLKVAKNDAKGLVAVQDEIASIISRLKGMTMPQSDPDIEVNLNSLAFEVEDVLIEEIETDDQ